MTYLLDINFLLASADPAHVRHESAHSWLGQRPEKFAWSTCAITENGFIRIASSNSYPTPSTPTEALSILQGLRADLGAHEFWNCDLTLTDKSKFQFDLVQGSKQLTDIYLLGLVVANRGCLVTLDRKIRTSHVVGANQDHLAII